VDRSPELRAAVEQASPWLATVVQESSSPVVAEWDRAGDAKGRDLLTLRLRDSEHAVSAVFTPAELTDRIHAELRFYHLYGDLLQLRIDRLINGIRLVPVGA
jgi:hypothetical protein